TSRYKTPEGSWFFLSFRNAKNSKFVQQHGR
ncbi:hypothetical protein AALP_AAs65669U000100, partial [Arabis alpina]